MSQRADLVAAVLAQLGELDALDGVPVRQWHGDADVFNDAAAFPSVWLQYGGASFGEPEEVGAATYQRVYTLRVFVATADPGGEAAALGYLEAIELGLAGSSPVEGLVVDAEGVEWLVDVVAGRYLFAQSYLCAFLESH